MSVNNIKNKDDYMYANQFHWFMGVIEDINDPEQRGRYRVRCFGYHTERKNYVPAVQLPWASVMMPVTSAAQCGIGESATGLLRGTWVIGFFRDGPTAQDPIIMGSLPTKTPLVDYAFGFCDPCAQYPYQSKVGDQDIPEEAISKDDMYKRSFSYMKKDEHRKLTPVDIAFSDEWELPPIDTIIQVEYPKNHVRAYERKVVNEPTPDTTEDTDGILQETPVRFSKDFGIDPIKEMHVQEFDVTVGWERISTMHCTGTYKEWTPIGDDTTVIVGDEYRVVVKDQHINVKGSCTLTVEGNLHTLVLGDEFRHIKGNLTEQIDGEKTVTVLGNIVKTHAANDVESVGANKTKNVVANESDQIAGFKGQAVGATQQEVTGGNDEKVSLSDTVINAVGTFETWINDKINMVANGALDLATKDNFVVNTIGDFIRRVGENVEESTVKDRKSCNGGALQVTSGGSAVFGSKGPSQHTGASTKTGDGVAVVLEP